MMNRFTFLLCFALVFLNCKGQQTKNAPVGKQEVTNNNIENYCFDTQVLLEDIKELSSDAYEGRRTGTQGAEKAKNYVIERFSQLGAKPLGVKYEQPFQFSSFGKSYEATNILALIKGTESSQGYIVLSAHYDHEGVKNGQIYNGADDDASGISALFAFASYFKNNPPKHHVITAAFDAEELGLKGAYHYVQNPLIPKESLKLNLNMDMISRSANNELFAIGSRYYPQLKPAIETFKGLGKARLLIGHEGLDKGDNWTNSSDHAAFHKAKIPFIYFGVPDHEDYHKPTDDFERIDHQFYKDAVQTIIRVFEVYDAMPL
ncbi:M28 family peptidase [Lacinutrix neustonica]|uniref:M28 family peptidase n=1 Tax=Lacinutrix neustonica TaxID=2980107 RepID=A0A9E8MV86_9FLAO|nr:M28 family peptidase [Lacinutrix neustonica]WAC01242.1 M28 family peptidase [Lacinutrix neustonica]